MDPLELRDCFRRSVQIHQHMPPGLGGQADRALSFNVPVIFSCRLATEEAGERRARGFIDHPGQPIPEVRGNGLEKWRCGECRTD
ncbi:hypothetical protein ACIGW3_11340 [Streptomyces sp. NPDC053499]|uniref:hypothetical protein n=1 Tax=Streptomyces TaxID=1883 RepID=UPI0036BEF303